MADDPHIDIGRLRWLVTLATRAQAANLANGITETIVNPVTVHADVQRVGLLTFWGSIQVETPVTHLIFMRWHEYITKTAVILRNSRRPDQSVRSEVFRVQSWAELAGRKRTIMVQTELEKEPA